MIENVHLVVRLTRYKGYKDRIQEFEKTSKNLTVQSSDKDLKQVSLFANFFFFEFLAPTLNADDFAISL